MDPPPVAECDATSGGETGCSEEEEEPPPPECANPEFGGTHPPAIAYECQGQAGGAIVYDQIAIEIKGELKGGPGSEPPPPDRGEEPEWTSFPTEEDAVGACCHGTPDADELDTACERDCGRRACNTVLDQLRAKAGQGDPSDGKCDALAFPDAIGNCQERIRDSIESWITQLEERYEDCVVAALKNSDPDLAYWEHEVPFADTRKIEFDDWSCSHNAVGCLFDAELRPFCEITGVTAQPMSACEQAGNPEDANAGGAVDDTGGDEGDDGGVAPFGEVDDDVDCSPSTTCTMTQELFDAVWSNFHVFYDEEVTMTFVTTPAKGYQIGGLDSGEHAEELFDAFGLVNGDIVTHVNGLSLGNTSALDAAYDSLQTQSSWTLRVRRWNGSSWATLDYTVSLAVSIGAPPSVEETVPSASGTTSADAPAVEAAEQAGSCACRTADSTGSFSGVALLLLAAGRLSRRRGRVVDGAAAPRGR